MGFLNRAVRLLVAAAAAILPLLLMAAAAAPKKPKQPVEKPVPADKPAAKAARPAKRPATVPATDKINVVIITGDDLGALLGCYGKPVVQTPNFDRLAARGIRFQRAYSQLPICNPSRASLFSGLTPERCGVLGQGQNYQPGQDDPPFMHRVFAANGYDTLQIGKIFHGHHEAVARVSKKTGKAAPLKATDDPEGWTHTWDKPIVSDAGKLNNSRDAMEQGKGEAREYKMLEGVDDTRLYDGVAAREVAEQLEVYAQTHRPFFMAVGFRKPHLPWHLPKQYFDLYKLEDIRLPVVPVGYEKTLPDIVKNNSVNDDEITVKQERELIRAYMAAVSYVDAQLGIVLDAMDKNDLWKNTIFVVTGDHGFMLGEHGMWGKRTLFEESCQVPLMMAGAGIKPGTVSPRTVENLDIYPTLMDVAGLPKHGKLMGRSLVPLLKDPQAEWTRPAYTIVYKDGDFGRSIRTERYRYTEWNDGKDHVELYDEEKDPGEYANLARDGNYAGVVGELRPLLHARKSEVRKLESFEHPLKKLGLVKNRREAKRLAIYGGIAAGVVLIAGVGFVVWRRNRRGAAAA
jgi:iduronate 2-sulfatase